MQVIYRVKPRKPSATNPMDEKVFMAEVVKTIESLHNLTGRPIDIITFGRQTHIFDMGISGGYTVRPYPMDKTKRECWVNMHQPNFKTMGDIPLDVVSAFVWASVQKDYKPEDCTKEMLKRLDPTGECKQQLKGSKKLDYSDTFKKRCIHWHKVRTPEILMASKNAVPIDKLLDMVNEAVA